MFFFLSKTAAFLITPIVWIFGLMVYSLFSKIPDRKRKSLGTAVLLFYIFSNSFVLDEAMRAWEIPAVHADSLEIYDAGIVLGGMIKYDKALDRTQYEQGSDRIIQAVELYKKGKIKTIFFTGGSGSIAYPDSKEAPYIKKFLLNMGIPDSCVLTESESKNTRENATFSKPILEKKFAAGKFLLITSAFHMRRSSACFNKIGIETAPFSVDRQSGSRKFELDHLFIPSADAFWHWSNLIHEWIGVLVYKIAGYA